VDDLRACRRTSTLGQEVPDLGDEAARCRVQQLDAVPLDRDAARAEVGVAETVLGLLPRQVVTRPVDLDVLGQARPVEVELVAAPGTRDVPVVHPGLRQPRGDEEVAGTSLGP
jgi:hypothetical protein